MTIHQLQSIADLLYTARTEGVPLDPSTVDGWDTMTVADAYTIMELNLSRREKNGSRQTGFKIGATNTAIMTAIGADEPVWSALYDDMLAPNGFSFEHLKLLAPKIEPEIAFVIGADLPNRPITRADLLPAVAGIMPAIEVADSRYINVKVTAREVIADCAHASHYIVGQTLTPLTGFDLRTLGVMLLKNGEVAATAAGAAVYGDPVDAVCWLANKLIVSGRQIFAGAVIMSGSFTSAIPAAPGDSFEAVFDRLGSVTIKI